MYINKIIEIEYTLNIENKTTTKNHIDLSYNIEISNAKMQVIPFEKTTLKLKLMPTTEKQLYLKHII